MAGKPGQVHGHREHIVQIHRDRIVALLAKRKGRSRRCGRQQHVAFLERLLEVAPDQRADLLGAGVVGVVVAGGEHISADQHAPLYFCAETFRPALLVQLE